jgi:hypothetical protein
MTASLPPLSNSPITFPGLPPLPPPLPIYERHTFFSGPFRKIDEYAHLDGTPIDETCPRFMAYGGVPISETIKSPDGKSAELRNRMLPIETIIQAESIVDAFDKFDAAILAQGAKRVRAMRADDMRARLTEGLPP